MLRTDWLHIRVRGPMSSLTMRSGMIVAKCDVKNSELITCRDDDTEDSRYFANQEVVPSLRPPEVEPSHARDQGFVL